MSKSNEYKPRGVKGDGGSSESSDVNQGNLIFGKKNYQFIVLGIVLIFLGMALMIGGHMPSPDVWDESLIYSFRRITLAPIFILIGLGLNVYAIFIKN